MFPQNHDHSADEALEGIQSEPARRLPTPNKCACASLRCLHACILACMRTSKHASGLPRPRVRASLTLNQSPRNAAARCRNSRRGARARRRTFESTNGACTERWPWPTQSLAAMRQRASCAPIAVATALQRLRPEGDNPWRANATHRIYGQCVGISTRSKLRGRPRDPPMDSCNMLRQASAHLPSRPQGVLET